MTSQSGHKQMFVRSWWRNLLLILILETMGRNTCSVISGAGTLICAEFRTATAGKQLESHVLSFHSNLLMQILFWWDWSTTAVNFFSSHSSTVHLFFWVAMMIHLCLLCPVWTLNTPAFVWKKITRNALNAYGFRHCISLVWDVFLLGNWFY